MLQSPVWPQLARLKLVVNSHGARSLMKPSSLGPMKSILNGVDSLLKIMPPMDKHWYCGGNRSIAVAVELLSQKQVIAVPTDTVYGLAALANDNDAVEKLYEIKSRDKSKPLAISLSSVKDVEKYGKVDHLPPGLLEQLLPGKVTMVLERTHEVNPNLNSGIPNVAIRVPDCSFIRSVAHLAGPLALTSANVSDQPSALQPEEFSDLWPALGGIFYMLSKKDTKLNIKRRGSTIIDLTEVGQYTILRPGSHPNDVIPILRRFGLTKKCSD